MERARVIIASTVFAAAIAWAAMHGYVAFVFDGDKSFVSYPITVILAWSIAAIVAGHRAHIVHAASACTALGFLGTLVGITMGLSGVDVSALTTPDGVIAAGTSLFGGVATAFCSTIVGAVAAFWIACLGMIVGVRAW